MAVAEPRKKLPRFEDVTETPGIPVSREGAVMVYTRYWVASQLACGKRVLELGCASAQGFGLLGRQATLIVGGDVSLGLLRNGHRHYRRRFPLVQLSAEQLPFRAAAFDLVLFFEASYYVPDMNAALAEIARVLCRDGRVLFVNANPERRDFIRSPHSVHYHTADELRRALNELGLSVTVEGAFPVDTATGRGRWSFLAPLVPTLRRALEVLGLVPKTLRARARLKRLLYGRLIDLPAELFEGFATVAPRVPVEAGPVRGFKVLYVTAIKP